MIGTVMSRGIPSRFQTDSKTVQSLSQADATRFVARELSLLSSSLFMWCAHECFTPIPTSENHLGQRHSVHFLILMTTSIPSTPRRFETGLFGLLLLQCYFLDYARPIANALVPAARGLPGVADWMHILAPIVLALIFLNFFARAAARGAHVWQTLNLLLLCVMCVGQGIHISADSIDGRMQMRHVGPMDVPPTDNPVVQALGEPVIEIFDLAYLYDECIGHWIWYAALYAVVLLYVLACREPSSSHSASSIRTKLLAAIVAGFLGVWWFYAGIEGGTWQGTVGLTASLIVVAIFNRLWGMRLDINGRCFVASLLLASVLIGAWAVAFNGSMPGVWEVWLRNFPVNPT